MQWKLKCTSFLLLGFTCIAACGAGGSLTLMQNTSTNNIVDLVCDNGPFMKIQGNTIQVYDFASVRDYANGAERLSCVLTVTGKDQSLRDAEVDGGTLAINIDTTNEKISISDIKFSNPVYGLYWIDRSQQVSPVKGEFSLNNTTIMFKDDTF